MKKTRLLPILTIFFLAVLITGGSWFYARKPLTLDASITKRGLPLPYWIHTTAAFDFGRDHLPTFSPKWHWSIMAVDFVFWCLVLGMGYLFLRLFLKRKKSE